MINLKLVGIVDNKYQKWKENLIQVMTDLGSEYELEEVNKVDEIISLGSNAIPALWLNNDLVLEQNGHIPQLKDLKKLFIVHLEKRRAS